MISADEWRAYNDAVDRIADGAAEQVRARVLAWCNEHPDASVAEFREAAKEVMAQFVQAYDEAAASLAAEWYDSQMSGGPKLPAAVTSVVYSPDDVNAVARYQARQLSKINADGTRDFGPFARACGEYAANDALKCLNETIVRNATRDEKRGVRYARVTSGATSCTFCVMLASRGAVYHSRDKAGLMRKFHRGCKCKVVPGYEDDPMRTLVEGHDPREAYDLWKKYEEVDADDSLSAEQRDARKLRILNRSSAKASPSTAYRADNLDLSDLLPGELKKMQKKNPLEWESYVHLSKSGYRQRLLHEQGDASANIDVLMLLDGEWHYWDMKTIEGKISSLKKRMAECYSKWVRLLEDGAIVPDGVDLSMLGNPRVVIDNRYSKIADADARNQIRESMEYLSGKGELEFTQAALILKDGSVEIIEK